MSRAVDLVEQLLRQHGYAGPAAASRPSLPPSPGRRRPPPQVPPAPGIMKAPGYRPYWEGKVLQFKEQGAANPYALAHVVGKRHQAKVPRLRAQVRAAAAAQVVAVDQALDAGQSEAAARVAAVDAFNHEWPPPRRQ